MKQIPKITFLLLVVSLLILPFVKDTDLMHSGETTKTLVFGFCTIVLVIVLFTEFLILRGFKFRIKLLDVALVLYMVYTALHPLLYKYKITPETLVETISLTGFYLVLRQFSYKQMHWLLYVIIIAGIIQAAYGSFQLYNFSHSNHSLFKLTGSFFNPGPYAGYLASVFSISLAFYLHQKYVQKKKLKFDFTYTIKHPGLAELRKFLFFIVSFVLKLLPVISIVLIVTLLPATQSRAAWLGVALGSVYLLFVYRNRIKQNIKLPSYITRLTKIQKRMIGVGGIVILFASLAVLYSFKQNSADGRLLIWKVVTQMVKDKPVYGHGTDQFAAQYMNYQAEHFKNNTNSQQTFLADNTTYAYNEFLKIAVEKGILGLFLALFVVATFFLAKRRNSLTAIAASSGCLTLLVFGMFSYPSDILLIKINFIAFLAIIANCQLPLKFPYLQVPPFTTKPLVALVSVTIMVLGFVSYSATSYFFTLQKAYTHWKDASDIYKVQAYPECLEDFELAYPELKTNGDFLIQYGKALSLAEDHNKAIEVLTKADEYLNNTILFTSLGDSHKALAENVKAEQAYLQGWYMVPNRFYPLYLLAKLYDETGLTEKAIEMANKIIEKEVKVPSNAINEIKEEMQEIINKYANMQVINQVEGKRQEANMKIQTASCLPSSLIKEGGKW